jgi:hypothetical protein
MPSEELTLSVGSAIGINQAIGVFVASITTPGRGLWRVWGSCRHSLGDGIRLRIGATNIINIIPQAPNETVQFGPIVFAISNSANSIILDLVVATGATDTASGVLYAQRITPL